MRVAVAVPIDPAVCKLLLAREPRIDLLVDQSLLPSQRYPADFAGEPTFRRSAPQQKSFELILREADSLLGIPDSDPSMLAWVVRRNDRLRWVHTMAAGGGAQVRAAGLTPEELRRVMFTTSAGIHGSALAEFAALGVLAGAKDLARLQTGKTTRDWPTRWSMRQLAGANALILGFGGIGRAVAGALKGLGMHITVMSRSVRADGSADEFITPDGLLSAAARADAIVQTLPGTAATEGLLDTRFFAALKPAATIVNVGRGSVIDECALIDALRDGKVGFAALDVFTREPLPVDNPLWTLPNVLISPHTAALTTDEERRIVELFAANATRLLDGLPLVNRVNTAEFY